MSDTATEIQPEAAEPAAETTEPVVNADATPPAEEVTAEAAPSAPGIDWDSPEVQDAIAERSRAEAQAVIDDLMAQAAAAETRATQAQPGTDTAPAQLPDPLEDPQGYAEGLFGRIGELIDQRLGPIVESHEAQENERALETLGQFMESLPEVKEAVELFEGEENPPNVALLAQTIGEAFWPAAAERFGETPRASQAAARRGAEVIRDTLKAAHKAGYEARDKELGTIAGAREEPGGGTGAAELVTLSENPEVALEEIANRVVSRHQRS